MVKWKIFRVLLLVWLGSSCMSLFSDGQLKRFPREFDFLDCQYARGSCDTEPPAAFGLDGDQDAQ